jgi:alpha-1,2-mannosyltransferase
MLTLRRARAHAVVVVLIFATVYAVGILGRRGLVDRFGHVIGGDLLMPRAAARMVLDGRGAQLYDFSLQTTYEQVAVEPQRLPGLNPFIWPPFVALFYVPWAFVPQGPAFVLWTACSLACLVAALVVMARAAPLTGQHWPSTVLLSLSFYPVLEGLMAGTNSLLSLLLFALMYRALRAGNDTTAGALLGLQLYRPQLAVAPLIVFAAKRRWRILAGAAWLGAAWVLLSTLCVGRRAILDWLALGPALNRMIFEPGMPYALLSSVSALFLLPLGPQHLGAGMAAGALASIGLLAVLLKIWAGPWEARADGFALRFAALLVVSPLVGQYLLLHDLVILILAAVLLVECSLREGGGKVPARVRVVLAILWLTCLIGPPIITRIVRLPLVPLAVLLLGWVVLDTWRAAETRA